MPHESADACTKSCERQPRWLHYVSTSVVVILAMTLHPLVSPDIRRKVWSGRWKSSPPLQVLTAACLAYSMTGHTSDTIAILVAYLLVRVTVLELL